MWVKGRHQLKFGYRLRRSHAVAVHPHRHAQHDQLRHATSSTTRSPTAAAPASPTLLLGYINNASRGFLLEPYVLRVQEHGAFIQDDFKVNAPADRQRRPALRDLQAPDRGGQSARQLRPVRTSLDLRRRERREPHRPTRRRSTATWRRASASTYDLLGDADDDSAHRLRHHLLPESALGRQPDRPAACPCAISQNVSTETNPLDFSKRADDRAIRSRRSCRSSRGRPRS